MNLPAQSIFQTFARGWKWWTGELADLVPGGGRGAARPLSPGIIVLADPSGLRLIDERGRRRNQRKGAAGSSGIDAWNTLVEIARARSAVPVRLRLPYSACFVRRVELPDAVRHDAGRFLELDLERATPFRLKDVYTAHFVDEARSRKGTLNVCHVIVPRTSVDTTVADIQASGVKIASIDCYNEDATSPLPVDFLPRDAATEKRATGSTRMLKLLSVAALMLAESAVYLALNRYESALTELTQQTVEARSRAEAVRQMGEISEVTKNEVRAVQKLKSERTPAVEIIESLTRILPDSVWLTDLRIEGDSIEFSGEAANAAPLVSAVENSKLFADASFTAPVTREAKGDKERFSMRARLRGGPAIKDPAAGEPAP